MSCGRTPPELLENSERLAVLRKGGVRVTGLQDLPAQVVGVGLLDAQGGRRQGQRVEEVERLPASSPREIVVAELPQEIGKVVAVLGQLHPVLAIGGLRPCQILVEANGGFVQSLRLDEPPVVQRHQAREVVIRPRQLERRHARR